MDEIIHSDQVEVREKVEIFQRKERKRSSNYLFHALWG